MPSNFKQGPKRLSTHLAFIRTLPCIKCQKNYDIQAAHLRAGIPSRFKGGMGYKSCDTCTLPLCEACHTKQGRIGEHEFWKTDLRNVFDLTQLLWLYTGQYDKAVEAIMRFRRAI